MSSPVCGENGSCKLRYSVKKIRGFYEKMGAFLVDLFQADQPGKGKQELQEELTALRTGSNETVRSYYIRKFSTVLMVLTIGVVLSIVCFFAYAGKTSDVEDQTLMRPGYGEGNRQEELAVEVDGKEVRQLEITIQERKYTEKEKRELTERAIKELEQILPGQNKSLDEVREDLVFPETLMDGAVTASYVTTPYGIVDESGVLLDVEKEDGVLVEIQVTLTCGENEMRHVVHAKVFPRILTQDEQLQKEIKRAVEQRDAKESHEETLELPGNVDGRRGLCGSTRKESVCNGICACPDRRRCLCIWRWTAGCMRGQKIEKSADAGLSGSDVENDNAAWGGAYDQRNVSENGEAVLQGQAKAEVCV